MHLVSSTPFGPLGCGCLIVPKLLHPEFNTRLGTCPHTPDAVLLGPNEFLSLELAR